MRRGLIIGVIAVIVLAIVFLPSMGYSNSLKDNAVVCDGCDTLTDDSITLWNDNDAVKIKGKIKFTWEYWQGTTTGDLSILIGKETVILTSESEVWSYTLLEGYSIYGDRSVDRGLRINIEDVNVFDALGGTQKPYPPRVEIFGG